MTPLLFVLILLFSAIVVVWFMWATHKVAKWMLVPGPEPDPDDEMGVAVHDFRVALSEALMPPLERITDWLNRRLTR